MSTPFCPLNEAATSFTGLRIARPAALAQPIDEPSDHKRGQQERDDHAHADKHVGENNSGAVLDGHGDPHEICTNTSVGSVERIAFEALSVSAAECDEEGRIGTEPMGVWGCFRIYPSHVPR